MPTTQAKLGLEFRARFGLTLAAIVLVSSGIVAKAAAVAFQDDTAVCGVTFTQSALSDTPGHPMHGGGAVGDFNNDGWPDIFVIGEGAVPDALFINKGDGTFENQAATWFSLPENLPLLYRGVGANVGDYNNDGKPDIFVTSMGDIPGDPAAGHHRLYRNNGDGTFSNVAVAAGVNQTALYPDGYGSTFGDYDQDGYLDLWVGGWHTDTVDGLRKGTRLFHNNRNGTFTDVSQVSKVYDNYVYGFGAVFADMNGDRYPEILMAGDFGTSRYFVNGRHGTFTGQNPLLPGNDVAHNGMGTTIADFNRDGLMDWYVGAIYPASQGRGAPGSRVYMNTGNNLFRDLPYSSGTQDLGWCWGATSPDFDNDGWPDLLQTGGWPDCDQTTLECFHDPVFVLRNNHDETFTDIHSAAGLDLVTQGRGMMTLDIDRDGDMDLVILSNDENLHLFRNNLIQPGQPAPSDANWLEVYLDTHLYPGLAPNGLGAKLTLQAPVSSSPAQTRLMNGGSNYLSGSEQMVAFGLADSSTADLTVEWPSGFRVVMPGVAANQRLTIVAQPPYSHAPLQAGVPVGLVVNGLIPGEVATYAYSLVGTGTGACVASMGGMCTDLLPPTKTIGTAVADVNGTATLTVTPGARHSIVYSQAVVTRGPGGNASLKTNVVVDTP